MLTKTNAMTVRKVLSVVLFFWLLLLQTSCKKQDALKQPQQGSNTVTSNRAVTNADLIAYKNSPHQLMMGYYRAWGDRTVTGNATSPIMTNMPDSVDILSVFPQGGEPQAFWNALKTQYIPALHAKGTKVIITTSLADYTWFTNNVPNYPHTYAGYAQYKNDQAVDMGYDGLDLDIETNLSGSELTHAISIFQALSVYFGPQSSTGRLLIYDTNQNGNSLMNGIKTYISYVFLQAYWRNVTSLSSTLSTYTPYISKSKFLVGVSFEDGTGNQPGQMPAYTQWAIQNQVGGVFSYGIDQEYVDNGNATTRAAIQAMNPSATTGSGTIVSGNAYKIVTGLNNSSVIDVPASATTDGTKLVLWAPNSPATSNQQWKVTDVGGGYYKLQPMHAQTKALTLSSTTNGTQTTISTDNGSNAQKWKITSVGNGYYTLSPANVPTGYLDVNASSTANGTKVIVWTASSPVTINQKWRLVQP